MLYLIKLLLATGLVLSIPACTSKNADPKSYFEQGKILFDQDNFDLAKIQLKNSVQADPKFSEGYYYLALIDEKTKQWKSMYANLQEVIKLNPQHTDAHLKLGQLYLASKEIDKSLAEAEGILKEKPDHIGAITLKGAVFLSQGKKSEALQQGNRALELSPNSLEATTLVAKIHESEGRLNEALAILDQGIKNHPKEVALKLFKITVLDKTKNSEGVIASFKTLISDQPQVKEFYYSLAHYLAKIGQMEQAGETLKSAINAIPKEVDVKIKWIDFLEGQKSHEVEATIKQWIELDPKQTSLYSRLAQFYLAHERPHDAENVLKRIIAIEEPSSPQALSAKVKLAGIAMDRQDPKTAGALLDEVLTIDANHIEALLARAIIKLERKESDSAISDLRTVLKSQPDHDSALVLLAQAHLQKGAPELALSHYRKALESNPGNLLAAVPVATDMLQRRDVNRAEEVINTLLKAHPNNPLGLELLAKVRMIKQDWQGAREATQKLSKTQSTPLAHFLSGVISVRQKNYDEAIKEFQWVLSEKPDMAEAIRSLALAYDAAGKRAQAIAFFKGFISKNPTVIEAYNILGMTYGSDKNWEAATKTLQDALVIDRKSPLTYLALAEIYLNQGKAKEVNEIVQKGLQELPNNIQLLTRQAQYYEITNHIDEAISIYTTIMEKDPKQDVVANNLASLLADHRTDAKNLDYAKSISERFNNSEQPFFLDTYGWVAFRTGELEKALSSLKKVVSRAPQVPVFRYHLGSAYLQAGDLCAAKLELENALSLAKNQNNFSELDHVKELLKTIK